MHKTRHAGFVYDYLGRHSPQLEQVDFLPVQLEYAGLRVGQANEGQVILLPVCCEGFVLFRTEDDHLCLPLDEFLVILVQLRQMLLAERSGKTAVED